MPSSPTTPPPTLLRPPSFHPATVEWTPGGQPKFVVFNPMHIVTLQDKTKTFAVRMVEKIKAISERWFTHVLLLLFLVGYGCLGAIVFQWIEGPVETREKVSITNMRTNIIKNLWNAHKQGMNEQAWERAAYRRMREYEEQIYKAYSVGINTDSERTLWTFWGGLFYSGTVFTTIGYGNIFPTTNAGRAVTIVYAFIGIPFLLMVLADLGKLFTRAIKFLFYYIRLFYHTGKFRKVRKVGRRATAVPVQYMSIAWRNIPYLSYPNKLMGKQKSADITDPNDQKNLEAGNNNVVKENGVKAKEAEDATSATEEQLLPLSRDEEVDDEFNLPVSLAVILLIAYMMLGALVFTFWEEWSFFESFYFVFISMSTIGFGDYVPDHPMYMMATFIYLLFGLALTSMCINVVQEKLSATFEAAKLRIGTTIGLDINALMAEQYSPEDDEITDLPEIHGKNKESLKSRRGSKAIKAKGSPEDERKKVPNDIKNAIEAPPKDKTEV